MTVPVTGEFAISASTSLNGPQPAATTLADGRILVSWYDIGSNGGDVKHRIFDADGTPLTGELTTPSSTAGKQTDQSVAALAGGGFVIVWESDVYGAPNGVDVHYRVHDANGSAVTTGLVTAGESAAFLQYDPVVIGTADGGFVVAWGDNNGDNANLDLDNQSALVARAYSAAGVASSGIVRITSVNGSAIHPALDADANGVVYVWDDNAQNGIITTTIPTGVPATDQTFDGTAVTSGPESTTLPDVAIIATGTVFVWEDFATDTVHYSFAGGPQQLGAESGNIRVDALPYGGFVIVWEQFSSATSWDIMCRVFDTDGTPVGVPVNLTEGQTGAQFAPDVTGLIDGRFMVTWSAEGETGDVIGRIYDPRTEAVSWTGGTIGERFYGTDIAGGTGDSLNGADGNDRIFGQKGNDTISGGEGNDLIDGGAGTDRLIGGLGNDTYVTDGSDVIIEQADEGIDTIRTTANLTLGNNIENLQIISATGRTVSGNSGDNTLTGGNGDDRIDGGGGTDRLVGGAGNDTYVTSGDDTIVEAANKGTDTVRSSGNHTLATHVENLVLTGTAALNGTGNGSNNRITGNSGNNRLDGGAGADDLFGGSGNDSLNGGTGKDDLTGGAGSDHFVFTTAPGSSNVDTITDYNVAADTIRIDNAVFTGLAGGGLSAGAFARNATGQAGDASDRIIYESDTGRLYFDRDGTGLAAKVHFATLDMNLGLTHADFFVF